MLQSDTYPNSDMSDLFRNLEAIIDEWFNFTQSSFAEYDTVPSHIAKPGRVTYNLMTNYSDENYIRLLKSLEEIFQKLHEYCDVNIIVSHRVEDLNTYEQTVEVIDLGICNALTYSTIVDNYPANGVLCITSKNIPDVFIFSPERKSPKLYRVDFTINLIQKESSNCPIKLDLVTVTEVESAEDDVIFDINANVISAGAPKKTSRFSSNIPLTPTHYLKDKIEVISTRLHSCEKSTTLEFELKDTVTSKSMSLTLDSVQSIAFCNKDDKDLIITCQWGNLVETKFQIAKSSYEAYKKGCYEEVEPHKLTLPGDTQVYTHLLL